MNHRKSILCIVPLPPPITGASAASEAAVNHLKANYDVVALSYSKNSLKSGNFSLVQVFRVLGIGFRIIIHRLFKKKFDRAYLVVSATFFGNLRDLYFLLVMGERLRKQTTLHQHGAQIDTYLRSAAGWVQRLNRRLLGDVKAAIVLSDTFRSVFDGYISRDKVCVVKNCFEPILLIPEAALAKKFENSEKIKILFLSNFIKEKGYELLADAFLSLPNEIKTRAELHFVGVMDMSAERGAFLGRIKRENNIAYHGPLIGDAKKQMLWDAHIFCLPTYYPFEAQPLTILEAYAAGCVVVASAQGGIKDIFADGLNGLLVQVDSRRPDSADLAAKLKKLIENLGNYSGVARHNRTEAAVKYTRAAYSENIERIVGCP